MGPLKSNFILSQCLKITKKTHFTVSSTAKKLADILAKNRNFQAYVFGADFTLINWIGAMLCGQVFGGVLHVWFFWLFLAPLCKFKL